jgi:V8-like Glu-specific endopeptidase
VGKLFFTMPEGDAVCSAAAVNTPQRNVIITAAHCAHSGDGSCGLLGCTAGQYFTNFLFVPRYANGSGPDGKWVGARAVTHSQWISSEDMGYDQALIEMHPNAGRRLVDVVGGNGLAWGYPPREADVAVWGWPAEPPYDGERVHVCTGSTDSFEGSADAGIACPMTGGSSGGPWFLAMVNRNVGFIWAVTSRRTVLGPRVLIARPLSAEIRRLISVVNARPVAPRSTAPRTAARPGKVRIRAVRRHVGRGQTIQLRVRTKAGARVVLQVRKSRRGKWKRVTVGRTNSARTVEFRLHARKAGLRWYRARTKRGISRPVRLRVHRCPFPLDRSPAVVQATGCSSPLR